MTGPQPRAATAAETRTRFEFINMVEIPQTDMRRTKIWEVQNNRSGDRLGYVRWAGEWRQYVFFPQGPTIQAQVIFSAGCLRDIAKFLDSARSVRNG